MNYDTMSVEELLDEIESDVVEGYPRDREKVAALRKAVIREASVGVVKLSHNGVASDYDIVLHKETP